MNSMEQQFSYIDIENVLQVIIALKVNFETKCIFLMSKQCKLKDFYLVKIINPRYNYNILKMQSSVEPS